MKQTITTLLVVFAIGILQIGNLSAQDRKIEREQKREEALNKTVELIESKQFTFIPRSVSSSKGRQIDVSTSSYNLTIDQDSIATYLPFFGRSYSASYGGDGAIQSNGDYTEYKSEINRDKMAINVSLEAEATKNDDTYIYTLTISHNGYATLQVTSRNRSMISYYGQISKIDKTE